MQAEDGIRVAPDRLECSSVRFRSAPGRTGCADKKQGIINQVELAKSHGDADQQAGLETALSEVTT
ncbi:DUF1090 domain-containing protein, partial [Pseudomonas sp. ANT_H12B]